MITISYCIVWFCFVLFCFVFSCLVLSCLVLSCLVLSCLVLYCLVLSCLVNCIVLYCTVLYCTVLYCTVLYCTVLYCIVLYYIVLYCIVLYLSYCILLYTDWLTDWWIDRYMNRWIDLFVYSEMTQQKLVHTYYYCLVSYFVEYFNVSWSEMKASSEKPTVTIWIPRGDGVYITAMGVRVLVVDSVVGYVDIMTAKSGSISVTPVHCRMLISILCQLHRIVSFGVVKWEDESFTGWGVTAWT